MKKLIIITALIAGTNLSANALDAYNWYDYNFNLAPNGASPLILPILPTGPIPYSGVSSMPAPTTTMHFSNTPKPGQYTQVTIPGDSRSYNGRMDGHGNFEIEN